MITIQRESFTEKWREGIAMMQAHHAEATTLPGEFNLNVPLYATGDAKGALLLVTARDNGVPVGYSTCWMGKHPQCKQITIAQGDTIYVTPPYRGRMIGVRIIKHMLKELKASSPLIVRYGSKVKADISPLLKRLGFELDEYSFTLQL